MQAGVMITNNGNHPADKYAELSARQITDLVVVDDSATNPQAAEARRAKRRLTEDLIDALEGHHEQVQKAERHQLKSDGAERHKLSLRAAEHHPQSLDEACKAVTEAAAKYPVLGNFFAEGEGAELVRKILSSHMDLVVHTERDWHKHLGKDWDTHVAEKAQQAPQQQQPAASDDGA